MILTDTQIREEVRKGRLISRGFTEANLGGCTYEFTVGPISYRYDYDAKNSRQERSTRHTLLPFETLTIITAERVSIDTNRFLLLFSKGSLFSLGLVPVCTGADPGFSGPLGITITNLSARPVTLPVGTRLVKGIFVQLIEHVEKPYVGQHGDATMDWPYPSQFHDDSMDPREYASHAMRFLPAPVAGAIELSTTVMRYLRWTMVAFALGILASCASFTISAFASYGWSRTLSDAIGIFASIADIAGLVLSTYAIAKVKRSV